jgi:antitoxin component of MazEF toxin-antitoxin module
MIKSITKIGNSQGLILDAALLEMAHLKTGDELNIQVHEGGTITLTPMRPRHAPEKVSAEITSVMKDYARTMRRLA